MRQTAFARWKANPQPLVFNRPLIHPRIAGRRAAVKVMAGELTFAEAIRQEVIIPAVRAWLISLARTWRLEFDRKARKRKRAARARCGYRK